MVIYDIDLKRRKKKAIISSSIPFHGLFSLRAKFSCSCLGRCFHSLVMKTPDILHRTQEQAKAGGGRECPGTPCSLICKQVFSFKLGLLCNFSKDILEQTSVMKEYQITRVLVARLWEHHTDTFSLFLKLLNLQFWSSFFSPCCAFNLNLTETMDELCNRHDWSLSPRKALWIS